MADFQSGKRLGGSSVFERRSSLPRADKVSFARVGVARHQNAPNGWVRNIAMDSPATRSCFNPNRDVDWLGPNGRCRHSSATWSKFLFSEATGFQEFAGNSAVV